MRWATRRAPLAALVLALGLTLPPVALGYAFLLVEGGGGLARRWQPERFVDARIPWFVTGSADGRLLGERRFADVVAAAFGRWEAVTESAIAFDFRGVMDRRNRDPGDSRNLVGFADGSALGSGVLGATFLTSDADGRITDADIVLSRAVDFTTDVDAPAGIYDAESVLTHEIGHLLGLDHTGLIRATMAPFTDRGDVHQRTLALDDAIGVAVLYPEGRFPEGRATLAGTVSRDGRGVFLAHVVATTIRGRAVASGYTRPDGTYRIEGLPPDVYLVHAERLDGPVRPSNVAGFREGFGQAETTDYETTFYYE